MITIYRIFLFRIEKTFNGAFTIIGEIKSKKKNGCLRFIKTKYSIEPVNLL